VRRDTLEVLHALGVDDAESKLDSDMRVCSDQFFKDDIYTDNAYDALQLKFEARPKGIKSVGEALPPKTPSVSER